MKFFPGQIKVREFSAWPGKFRKDMESQGKVREFENKWLWQAVFRTLIYSVQEGKGCTFSEIVFLLIGSLGEQILSFKSIPKFEVIQLAPLK